MHVYILVCLLATKDSYDRQATVPVVTRICMQVDSRNLVKCTWTITNWKKLELSSSHKFCLLIHVQ